MGTPRGLRHRLMRDLALLTVFVAAAAFGVAYGERTRWNRHIAKERISDARARSAAAMEQFLRPVDGVLTLVQKWGEIGVLDLADLEGLNAKFMPILEILPHIGALRLVDAHGRYYDLHRGPVRWTTRSHPAGEWRGRLERTSWSGPSEAVEKDVEEGSPDPLSQEWSRAVFDAPDTDRITWTPPHLNPSTGAVSLAAGLRWKAPGPEGGVTAGVLEILFDSLVGEISRLKPTENGEVFLVTRSGATIDSESRFDILDEDPVTGRLTYRSAASPDPRILDAVERWRAGAEGEEVFRLEETRDWAGFRALGPAGTATHLGVVIPQADLLAGVGGGRVLLPALGVVAAGLALAAWIVVRHGRRLKALPERLLDRPDFEEALADVLQKGESDRVEFKSTLRMNLRSGKAGKEIERAWLKTVVAYLNGGGGVLLIGVDDAGNLVGLDADGFENDDRCRLHIKNLIQQHVGLEHAERIRFDLRSIGGRAVAVVEVEPSPQPAFLRNKAEEAFFVRSGPASVQLSSSQMLDYLKQRP